MSSGADAATMRRPPALEADDDDGSSGKHSYVNQASQVNNDSMLCWSLFE